MCLADGIATPATICDHVERHQLGRVCIGIELEPAYVEMAIARWEGFTGLRAERLNGEQLAA